MRTRSFGTGAARWMMALCVACGLLPAAVSARPPAVVSVEFGREYVEVGDPGNQPLAPVERDYFDSLSSVPGPIGGVDHSFRVSRTNVTVGEWIAFLQMAWPVWREIGGNAGGFEWTGPFVTNDGSSSSPLYRLAFGADPEWPTRACWRAAAIYCNWLHHGRPVGAGVNLDVFRSGAYSTATFTRNPDQTYNDQIAHSEGARFWLPTLHEWIKAAYHDPDRYGPGGGGFWLYSHAQQQVPLRAGPGYGFWTSANVRVGTYPAVQSPWGGRDFMGNLYGEWTETLAPAGFAGGNRHRATHGVQEAKNSAYRSGSATSSGARIRLAAALAPGEAEHGRASTRREGGADGAAVAANVRVIAMSGEQAPDSPAGVVFRGFGAPTLNDVGFVSFAADVQGPGVEANSGMGVWAQRGGALRLLARSGGQAHGAPQGIEYRMCAGYEAYLAAAMNRDGTCLLATSTGDSAVQEFNGSGLWMGRPGEELTRVGSTGDIAPELPPGVLIGVGSPPGFPSMHGWLADDGRLVYGAALMGEGIAQHFNNDIAHWSWERGAPRLLIWKGQDAPGVPGFRVGNIGAAYFPADGSLLFEALLIEEKPVEFRSCLWSWQAPGQPSPGWREGDLSPIGPPGATLGGVQVHGLLDDGRLGLQLAIQGAGLPTGPNSAVVRASEEAWELVAREGDSAVGAPPGTVFDSVWGLFNSRGECVLSVRLEGPNISPEHNPHGLWRATSGEPELVVMTGSEAPGVAGAQFLSPLGGLTFETDGFNVAGQIAFVGYVSGLGITESNSKAIWMQDRGGQLRRLLGEGDDVEISPGAVRRIRELDAQIQGSTLGITRNFNGRGQIVCRALFDDLTQAILMVEGGAVTPGDVNGDGRVNFLDLNLVLSHFGGHSEGDLVMPGDADADGDTDMVDLNVVLGAYGGS